MILKFKNNLALFDAENCREKFEKGFTKKIFTEKRVEQQSVPSTLSSAHQSSARKVRLSLSNFVKFWKLRNTNLKTIWYPNDLKCHVRNIKCKNYEQLECYFSSNKHKISI